MFIILLSSSICFLSYFDSSNYVLKRSFTLCSSIYLSMCVLWLSSQSSIAFIFISLNIYFIITHFLIASSTLRLLFYRFFNLFHCVLVAIFLIIDIPYENYDLIIVLHKLYLFIRSMFFIYMFIIRQANFDTFFLIALIFSSMLSFVVIYVPSYVNFL